MTRRRHSLLPPPAWRTDTWISTCFCRRTWTDRPGNLKTITDKEHLSNLEIQQGQSTITGLFTTTSLSSWCSLTSYQGMEFIVNVTDPAQQAACPLGERKWGILTSTRKVKSHSMQELTAAVKSEPRTTENSEVPCKDWQKSRERPRAGSSPCCRRGRAAVRVWRRLAWTLTALSDNTESSSQHWTSWQIPRNGNRAHVLDKAE